MSSLRERLAKVLAVHAKDSDYIDYGGSVGLMAFFLSDPALDKALEDAERYAYLRDNPPTKLAVRRFPGETERGCYLDAEQLDAAIDEALAAVLGEEG